MTCTVLSSCKRPAKNTSQHYVLQDKRPALYGLMRYKHCSVQAHVILATRSEGFFIAGISQPIQHTFTTRLCMHAEKDRALRCQAEAFLLGCQLCCLWYFE